MLKKRIITTLILQNGILFRSKKFEPDYRYTHKFIDMWSIDEVVVLDITRNLKFENPEKKNFFNMLENISKNSVVPFSVGGGIRSLNNIRQLLQKGADKIVINSACINDPGFIKLSSKEFGSQCIVVSVDVKKIDETHHVFTSYGTKKTLHKLREWIKIVQNEGAGEIFLQSIDKDGSLEGYDFEMVENISDLIEVPLIVSGGAGNWEHFENLLKYEHVSGASTTNIYHFTESSINNLKKYLFKKNIEVRL